MEYIDQSEEVEWQLKEKLNTMGLMTDEKYDNLNERDKFLLLEVYKVIRLRQINRVKYLKAFKDQAITKSAIGNKLPFQEELYIIRTLLWS